MACYSLCQYTATVIDEFFFSYLADFEFLYQDIILNLTFVFILGNIPTAERLSKEKPSNSLFSVGNIVQLLLFYLIQFSVQILAIFAAGGPYANSLNYYNIAGMKVNHERFSANNNTFLIDSTESNITFILSDMFILASILGFMITKPWKK